MTCPETCIAPSYCIFDYLFTLFTRLNGEFRFSLWVIGHFNKISSNTSHRNERNIFSREIYTIINVDCCSTNEV